MIPDRHPNQDIARFATKAEWVADALRRSILSGKLKPGERLRQDEIAEQFQVSSTPIREALQLLAAEGFTELLPHRGAQVTDPETYDLRHVRELCLIRCALEGLAVELAVPQLTDEELETLKGLQESIRLEMVRTSAERIRELNYRFHFTLYGASQAPFLHKLIRSLWVRFPWDTLLELDSRAQNSDREHQAILKAVLARDPESAGAAMRRHILKGGETIADFLTSHPAEEGVERGPV